MFTNDLFKNGKPDSNPNNWKETVITNGVTIGSGVTLLPIVISATDVVIGAGAVVTKDITQSGVYFGNPAKINASL
jgi:acetyltransferase-like isoleucine patch superfamily enzyme